MPTIFSANHSSVLVNGEAVEGLQSLVFRVVTERQDVRGVGVDERVDVLFGLRTVQGELIVQSANHTLDDHLAARSKFQIVANLARDAAEGAKRTLSFDDCYVENKSVALSANGSVFTTYTFTATRVREE